MERSWDEDQVPAIPDFLKANTHVGLIITDVHLNPIAFNREAAAILSCPDRSVSTPGNLHIPEEIREPIRNLDAHGRSCLVTEFRRGEKKYVCRACLLIGTDRGSGQDYGRALILERRFPFSDALDEAAVRYRLTQREHETLKGLAEGLSGKEMATRMQISPNTVKSFMRLIMVKMGVDSRAAIVNKVLGQMNTQLDERDAET